MPEGRIACPYDSKHTCDARKLSKHLGKCPSKPEPFPEYIRIGANGSSGSGDVTALSIRDTSDEQLLDLIARVDKVVAHLIFPLKKSIQFNFFQLFFFPASFFIFSYV
jgi:tRNA:m4X modification enzyme